MCVWELRERRGKRKSRGQSPENKSYNWKPNRYIVTISFRVLSLPITGLRGLQIQSSMSTKKYYVLTLHLGDSNTIEHVLKVYSKISYSPPSLNINLCCHVLPHKRTTVPTLLSDDEFSFQELIGIKNVKGRKRKLEINKLIHK